mgnify:FL=1
MKREIKTSATIKRILRHHFNVKLNRDDLIHHIDHNRLNNDIRNLVKLNPQEHGLAHKGIPTAPTTPRAFLQWLTDVRAHPWKYRTILCTRIKETNSYANLPCVGCHQLFKIGDLYTSQNNHQWHSECFKG